MARRNVVSVSMPEPLAEAAEARARALRLGMSTYVKILVVNDIRKGGPIEVAPDDAGQRVINFAERTAPTEGRNE